MDHARSIQVDTDTLSCAPPCSYDISSTGYAQQWTWPTVGKSIRISLVRLLGPGSLSSKPTLSRQMCKLKEKSQDVMDK